MKKTASLLFLTVLFFVTAHARYSRNNNKSSNLYRKSYQRVAAGHYSNSTFENSWWSAMGLGRIGNGRNNYALTENTFLSGKAFYRVRQTDINGRTSYSQTILMTSQKAGALTASLSPNPIQSAANLEVHTASGGTLKYQVTDAMGRKLQSGSFVVTEGVNVLTLLTATLSKGVYLWQGNLGGQDLTLRFVKQ